MALAITAEQEQLVDAVSRFAGRHAPIDKTRASVRLDRGRRITPWWQEFVARRLSRRAPARAGRWSGRGPRGHGLRGRGGRRGAIARPAAEHGDRKRRRESRRCVGQAAASPIWSRARPRSSCCPSTPTSKQSGKGAAGGSTARPDRSWEFLRHTTFCWLRAQETAPNCGSRSTLAHRGRGCWSRGSRAPISAPTWGCCNSTDHAVPTSAVLSGISTERARCVVLALAACAAAGTVRHCADAATEYIRTREQFGRPIGAFQALQHKAAVLLVNSELAAAAAWDAVRAADESIEQHRIAAAIRRADGDRHRARPGARRTADVRRDRLHVGARHPPVLAPRHQPGRVAGTDDAVEPRSGRVGPHAEALHRSESR